MPYQSGHFTDDDIVWIVAARAEELGNKEIAAYKKAESHVLECRDCGEKYLAALDRLRKQQKIDVDPRDYGSFEET